MRLFFRPKSVNEGELSEKDKRAFQYFFIPPWKKFDFKNCRTFVTVEAVFKFMKIAVLTTQVISLKMYFYYSRSVRARKGETSEKVIK